MTSHVRRAIQGWTRAPILTAFWALVPILGLAVWVTVDPPYVNSPPIRSDGLGYYAWTDAIVHGNFDFCQWTVLNTVSAMGGPGPTHPSRCEMKYPPGWALLRLPVMGPLALTEDPSGGRNFVISDAEEKASQWLGVAALLAMIGLVLAALRRLAVRPAVANVVALAACFGTGLFHYGTFDGSVNPHLYEAVLFAGLMYAGARAAACGDEPNPFVVGTLVFFITLTRQPDFLVVLVLVAGWLLSRARPLSGDERRRVAIRAAVPVLVALGLSMAIEVLYVHWATGAWTLSSYRGETFNVSRLKELDVLFSFHKGLFTWYPVLAVMLLAALWNRPSRKWGILALICVAVDAVVYGSWNPWDLGAGFGHRGFVDIVPIVALAGGIGIAGLRLRGRLVTLGALVVCSLATVELMAGYWTATIPYSGTTAHQYWRQVVGRDSLLNGHL